MDLEIGLKVSHTADGGTSSSDFRMAKNKSGPVFISNETESSFVLTAHLKGYKKEHVDIDIIEEGTQLGITVEKPVNEKVMSGWSMKSKEGETRGFRKVFRIPDGVVLSRIKAKFNDQDSILKIFMPKVVKGVVGVEVKELKEEGVIIRRPQMKEAASDEIPETEKMRMKKNSQLAKGKEVENENYTREIVVDDHQQLQTNDPRETKGGGMISEESKKQKIAENEEADRRIKEEAHGGVKIDKSTEATHRVAKPSQEIEETETRIEEPASKHPNLSEMPEAMQEKKEVHKYECSEMRKGNDVGEKSTAEKKPAASEKSKLLSTPLIIAGSALLVSIVLLAIHRIRNRKK